MIERYTTGLFLFLIVLVSACSEREVSIFSIPSSATPAQLEANGFVLQRDLNLFAEIDKHHDGKVESGRLELGYALVEVYYPDEDETEMTAYVIHIDCKPFEKMTGFKAKEYAVLELEGYEYQVQMNQGGMSLLLKRLGLKKR